MSEHKIIGVTPLYCDEKKSIWMLPAYMDMLEQAGLLPIILPSHAGDEEIRQLNDICDGFLFTGGHDVNPEVYGCKKSINCGEINADRDALESRLFQTAFLSDKPMLGICRGIQFINAMLGGTLYQDLNSEFKSGIEHHMAPPYNRHVHTVTIQKGILSEIISAKTIGVNSYHHQAIKTLADGLHVEAISEDGLIEAVSYPGKKFILAVQWHPEFIYKEDENCAGIIRAFADAVCHNGNDFCAVPRL